MLCYNKQSLVGKTRIVPPHLTWHICQIVVVCLSPIVTTYVLSQYKEHWLLSDALDSTISTSLKLNEEPSC
jgi:hypothetical protein